MFILLLAVLAAPAVVAVSSDGQQRSTAGAPVRTGSGGLAVTKLYGTRTAGITLIAGDGSGQTMLTRHAGWVDDDPAWSPDKRWIAFTRTTDAHRSFHVFLMRADGNGARRLTGGRYDERPAWSPDQRWIVYQSGSGLQRVHPDGSGRRRVAGTEQATSPAWAPDGDRIAFSQGGYIWTARPGGGGRRKLLAGREPDWSPNGNRIAFTLPNGGIATVRATGGDKRYLGKGLQPDYSPDGRRIAFTRWPASLDFSVWVMQADGTGVNRVIGDARAPDWRR